MCLLLTIATFGGNSKTQYNGPHCLVACVPRQEGQGFDPICRGKRGLLSLGANGIQ
jgi:hypothetical protein